MKRPPPWTFRVAALAFGAAALAVGVSASAGTPVQGAPATAQASAKPSAPSPTTVKASTTVNVASVLLASQVAAAAADYPCNPGTSCYDIRHDFIVTVPPRPGRAAAENAVAQAKSNLAKVDAAKAELDKEKATIEADSASGKLSAEKAATAKEALATKYLQAAQARAAAQDAQKSAEEALAAIARPADLELTGTGFILVAGRPTAPVNYPCFGSVPGPNGQPIDAFQDLKSSGKLAVIPDQGHFNYCQLSVGEAETVVAGSGDVRPPKQFSIRGAGVWKDSVFLPPGSTNGPNAAYATVVSKYTPAPDGGLTVEGFVRATGTANGGLMIQATVYVFSHSSFMLTGGADISRAIVDWGPDLAVQTPMNGRAVVYDPVTLAVVSGGKRIRREPVFDVQLKSRGSSALHFKAGGLERSDAEDAELRVRVPGSITSERSDLDVGIQGGAVVRRNATGVLASRKLPALGARLRAPVESAPKLPKKPAPEKSEKLRLDIAVPKLKAGERFELHLGGAGAIEG